MGQQEYDAFKERMKQWVLDNANIYDEFEEMMNSQSDAGYQRIMATAMAFVPKYGKAISKKMNSGSEGNTLDIEEMFASENLGAKLIGQFEGVAEDSIVPAMICWLFFGRSFENMVERGEEIMGNPNINRFQSFLIARSTKMLIKKSINLGLRTREDWEQYNDFKKVVNTNGVMEWALSSIEEQDEKRTRLHRPECVSTLENMILLDGERNNKLLEKIEQYIHTGGKGKRVAFMILALRGL